MYFFHKINNDLTVELKPLCFQHVSTVPPFLSAIFLHITFLKIPEGTMTSFQEQICFGSEHLLQTQQHLVARQQLCHHGIFQGLKTRNLLGNVPPVFLSQYHGLAKNYGTKHEINKHKHPVFNSFWVCKNLGSFANSFLHIICNSGAGHGIAVLQREHHTVHEILGRTGSCRQQPFFSGMVHWELPGHLVRAPSLPPLGITVEAGKSTVVVVVVVVVLLLLLLVVVVVVVLVVVVAQALVVK